MIKYEVSMEKHINFKSIEKMIFKQTFFEKFMAVLIGCLFITISIVMFIRPNQMIAAGVNGMSILIEHATGIPLSILVFALNLPLLIIGVFLLSREFIFFTILSTVFTSLYIAMWTAILPKGFAVTHDLILASIFGGIFSGIGNGITFRYGTSTGGFDILGAIAKKYWNVNIGSGLLALNGIVIAISAFVFSIDKALYTLIAFIIGYTLVDKIHLGVGKQKQVLIISSKWDEVTEMIQAKLGRGVTLIDGEGAYQFKKLKIIYCICTSMELVKLKNYVKLVDPKAFMSVSETAEIQGHGFKKIAI